jgi:hypothetical protein
VMRHVTPRIIMFFNRSMAMPWPRLLADLPGAVPHRGISPLTARR